MKLLPGASWHKLELEWELSVANKSDRLSTVEDRLVRLTRPSCE